MIMGYYRDIHTMGPDFKVTRRLFILIAVTLLALSSAGLRLREKGLIGKSLQVVTSTGLPDDTTQPGLWIYVSSWDEGLSSWRKSLAEILVVARSLNATLVEPCVKNGRLLSCGDSGLVKLGDIFNMTKLKEFHPAISSFEEFQKQTERDDAKWFSICMHAGNPRGICGKLKSRHNNERSIEINHSVNASLHFPSVLEVRHFRKTAFFNMRHNDSFLLQKQDWTDVRKRHLTFRDEHHAKVNQHVKNMGINGTFSVIHWRAELKGIDYMKCARAILKARDAMNKTSHAEDFILMSSLNMDSNLQWGGVQQMTKNSSSNSALSLLLDAGFHKLDTVVEDVQDQVFLAVWDLILAVKAEAYATCSRCRSNFCSKCNFNGNFARLSLELRGNSNKSKRSHSCWPS